jgi:hypothetical protein
MSFLKSLFGGGKSGSAAPAGPVRSEDHEGYRIEAAPIREGDQFLIAGTISKEIGGERREHRFIRADRAPSLEAATEMTLRKAKQIIEQSGERMFG